MRYWSVKILLSTIFLLCLGSCSLDKLLESGQYDEVIEKAIVKLNRKPNDYHAMDMLKKAYFSSTNKELAKIDNFKMADSVNWLGVYKTYQVIERRQNLINNLDNLNKFSGIQDYSNEKQQAQENAADAHYQRAAKISENAVKKAEHQKAYEKFKLVEQIYPGYKDTEKRIKEEKDAGTFHIILNVENPYNLKLPPSFYKELNKLNLSGLNNEWMRFYNAYEPGFTYDFTAKLELHNFVVSKNRISKKTTTEKEEVIDKYVKQKDANGKVLLDAKGKPKVKAVYKEVSASVTVTTRSKTVRVKGNLQLVDNFTMNTYKSYPIVSLEHWNSETATYKGDKRAISKDKKRLIGKKLQPYPSYEQMVVKGAEQLGSSTVTYLRIFRNKFQEE